MRDLQEVALELRDAAAAANDASAKDVRIIGNVTSSEVIALTQHYVRLEHMARKQILVRKSTPETSSFVPPGCD